MANLDANRLLAMQRQFGASIPPDVTAAIANMEPITEGKVALLTGVRVFDVRTTFRLDDGEPDVQLDRVCDLVSDALPPGAMPFAEDWGGNLYCVMLFGPLKGKVVWWDHERDPSDHSVEVVSPSIPEFYAALVPDPRE